MRRVLVDLKDPEGREAFLSLAAAADVVVESFRPGVVDRLGVGYSAVSERNPGVVYCSTSGYGQDGPASQWAGHDIDYLAVGGFLAMSTPGVGGAPPLPGATVADAAAGGMQAALAITAALAGRATTGRGAYLDVSVAEGVLWLTSLAIDEQLALGGDVLPGHDVLVGAVRLLRDVRGVGREVAGGGSHRGEVLRQPVRGAGCAGAGCAAVRRRGAGRGSGRRSWRRSLGGRGTSGWLCWPGPTPAWRRCSRSPRWLRRRSSWPGAWSGRRRIRRRARCAQLAPLLAGMARPRRGRPVALARHDADRHGAPLEGGRSGRRDGGPLGGPAGGGMTATTWRRPWPRCATSSARSSTTRWGSSPSSAPTSGPRAPRWRTATRSTGTTRWPTC